MSKIKSILPDDIVVDDNGMYDEAIYNAELVDYMNSIEGQLASFTSQQLIDEYYRRMFADYKKSLQDMIDKLDNFIAPF